MDTDSNCLGRVVDILEASGAFDPGSNPGRGVSHWGYNPSFICTLYAYGFETLGTHD